MKKNDYSMFCVDLKKYSNVSELDQFLKKTGINMDSEYLYSAYKGMIIPCYKVDKVWIDSVTLNFIAMESCGYNLFYDKFSKFLDTIQPIDSNYSYGQIKSTYSIFCIDFRNFSSFEEFDTLIKTTGLDLDTYSWFNAYIDKKIFKVWVDAITLNLIAYQNTIHRKFIFDDFNLSIKSSRPIDSNFKFGNHNYRLRDDITVDSLLDKILEKGIQSLSPFEKNFLDKNSQN